MLFGSWIKEINPRVVLCCIVKNENDYLREYCEYYHQLGINHIFIYDNNSLDGERPEEIVSAFDYVTVVNFRGKEKCQCEAYADCVRKCRDDYDWICIFDADEFLQLNHATTIQEYLQNPIFRHYSCIKINWKNYSDNGLLGHENDFDRNVVNRFMSCVKHSPLQKEVKSIARLKAVRKVKNPHTMRVLGLYCNNRGRISNKSQYCSVDWTYAQVNHYRKTIIEFIEHKFNRGWADDCPVILDFDWFWRYSEKTVVKEKIANFFVANHRIPSPLEIEAIIKES